MNHIQSNASADEELLRQGMRSMCITIILVSRFSNWDELVRTKTAKAARLMKAIGDCMKAVNSTIDRMEILRRRAATGNGHQRDRGQIGTPEYPRFDESTRQLWISLNVVHRDIHRRIPEMLRKPGQAATLLQAVAACQRRRLTSKVESRSNGVASDEKKAVRVRRELRHGHKV